jgi:D-alanyl-D-alanine carboxypeptidase
MIVPLLSAVSVVLLAAACFSQTVMEQMTADRNARVKGVIDEERADGEFPGVQYVVVSRNSTLFSYAGGWADIEGGREVQKNTTMMVYSMTKTITAAAVLQLIEQGKISLNDPVADYLPDIPYGRELKISHLLSQTSGIPNPIPLRWIHLVEEHARFDQAAALREVLEDNSKLKFTPGAQFGYSNISYWLLGYIIEKVSGISYEQYVRQHIFRTLAIPESEIDFVIPAHQRHAKGYLPKWSLMNMFKSLVVDPKFSGEYEDGWLHVYDHYINGPSFGGIIASAEAIGIFLQDQLQDSSKLFSKDTKALFFQQQKNNAGQPVPMTLGWHIASLDTIRYFFKEGGGGGFHCEMRVYPTAGIASVVIANNASFDPGGFLKIVDREFLHQ